jgi:hypothetical protein
MTLERGVGFSHQPRAETREGRRVNWYSPSNHDIIIQIDRCAGEPRGAAQAGTATLL